MKEAKVRDKVYSVLQDHFGFTDDGEGGFNYQSKPVIDESLLRDDLGADSLDAVEVTMELEDMLDISITDDEISSFKTVRDVIVMCAMKFMLDKMGK